METLKNTIFFLSITFFITGCTTKAKIVDGQRYTQTWGSNEWQYAGEIKPAEQKNASTLEESISYTAGQVASALAVTRAHIITSPIRAVETISKTDSNTSNLSVEKNKYSK